MAEFILVERLEGGVALVTVHRPPVNALNRQVLAELGDAVAALDGESGVHAVVITGGGEKAFVAGADIAEMKEMTPAEAAEFSRFGQSVFTRIKRLEQPVIAAVNGHALGGGCELAMACDLRVAAENAKFGQPEINLGIIPGFGGTVRLTRLVGPAKARELVLTGSPISADEALRIGLVNRVVPQGAVRSSALDWARELAAKPAAAIALAKASMREGWDLPVDAALEAEAAHFSDAFETHDQKEGMAAYLEKRKPEFKGK